MTVEKINDGFIFIHIWMLAGIILCKMCLSYVKNRQLYINSAG